MIYLPIISLGLLILFLMGALISFQYFSHYQSLTLYERTHLADQRQRAQTALGFLAAFCFGAIIALGGLVLPASMGFSPTPNPPISTDTAYPGVSTSASTEETPNNPVVEDSISTEPVEPRPQLTPTRTLPSATIGNTGGAGANIRSSPGLGGPIIDTLADGTRVFLLNESQTIDGFDWEYIEMPDTREGWVVVQFLIPEN